MANFSQSAFLVKLDKRCQSNKMSSSFTTDFGNLYLNLKLHMITFNIVSCIYFLTGKQHSTSTFPFTWFHQNTGKALYYNGQEGKREGRREEYSVFRKSFELERDVDWTPPTPPASSLSPPDWLKTSPFLASVSHSLSRTICHQVFWSLPSQHSRLCQSLYSFSD